MSFLRVILSWVSNLANTMASWASKAAKWRWPLDIIAPIIITLSSITDAIWSSLFDFTFWFEGFVEHTKTFLTEAWGAAMRGDFNALRAAWDRYVAVTLPGLQDLIEAQIANWTNLWAVTLPMLTNRLDAVDAAWDNFWIQVWPTVVDRSFLLSWWQDKMGLIEELIASQFKLAEDLWRGWSEIRGSVLEFFADPCQWVYDRLDEFFERFW